MEYIINNMTADDVGEIYKLECECFSSPWSEKSISEELNNEQAHFLVAKDKDVVIGYIGVIEVCNEAYITNVAVTNNYRRLGVGETLLKASIDGSKKRFCSFITLEVRTSNYGAIALYEKIGFKCVGCRKNFYSNPQEDGLIYTLNFGE